MLYVNYTVVYRIPEQITLVRVGNKTYLGDRMRKCLNILNLGK